MTGYKMHHWIELQMLYQREGNEKVAEVLCVSFSKTCKRDGTQGTEPLIK